MSSKEDCFHLGVKALIRNREGKVLLIKTERVSKETYWELPGGRLQKGETVLEALQREIEEEIGLKEIDGVTLLCTHLTDMRIQDPDVGLILTVYTFEAPFNFIPQLGGKHIDFCWLDISEAVEYLKADYYFVWEFCTRSRGLTHYR